jgi:galactoside O-acetyltransferase
MSNIVTLKRIINIPIFLKNEIRVFFESFIMQLPGETGFLARKIYFSGKFLKGSSNRISPLCFITSPSNISIGENFILMQRCSLCAHNNGKIYIGNDVGVNSNSMINAADGGVICIGNNVLIGPNVVIRASNHCYSKKEVLIKNQGHSGGCIEIGDDVWIGANVVILTNVKIGKGSIIGAGAVVTKDIPPFSLAAGVSARLVKADCRQ